MIRSDVLKKDEPVPVTRLGIIRRGNGHTLHDVSRVTGITACHIRNIELGRLKSRPKLGTIEKLKLYYGLDVVCRIVWPTKKEGQLYLDRATVRKKIRSLMLKLHPDKPDWQRHEPFAELNRLLKEM